MRFKKLGAQIPEIALNLVPLHALKAVSMTRPGAVRPGIGTHSSGISYPVCVMRPL